VNRPELLDFVESSFERSRVYNKNPNNKRKITYLDGEGPTLIKREEHDCQHDGATQNFWDQRRCEKQMFNQFVSPFFSPPLTNIVKDDVSEHDRSDKIAQSHDNKSHDQEDHHETDTEQNDSQVLQLSVHFVLQIRSIAFSDKLSQPSSHKQNEHKEANDERESERGHNNLSIVHNVNPIKSRHKRAADGNSVTKTSISKRREMKGYLLDGDDCNRDSHSESCDRKDRHNDGRGFRHDGNSLGPQVHKDQNGQGKKQR
jgi:hypothetical protein